MRVPDRLRVLVEVALPWYDREEHLRHDVASALLTKQAIVARRNAAVVRTAYVKSAQRLGRK